jgi:NAD(P)-dependent dehydrogenase (short-subunit alcohol dehydrogenase family)
MVDCAVAEFGRLDMAFDNAGIQVPPSDAADERIVHFERVTAVNQRGVWACMKHELRVIQVPPSDAADERIVHFERVTAVNQRGSGPA